VLSQPLPSDHNGNRRFGDEVVAEGAEENALEVAATAGADDDERGLEIVDLKRTGACEYDNADE